jgi:hypothetical protein
VGVFRSNATTIGLHYHGHCIHWQKRHLNISSLGSPNKIRKHNVSKSINKQVKQLKWLGLRRDTNIAFNTSVAFLFG